MINKIKMCINIKNKGIYFLVNLMVKKYIVLYGKSKMQIM